MEKILFLVLFLFQLQFVVPFVGPLILMYQFSFDNLQSCFSTIG